MNKLFGLVLLMVGMFLVVGVGVNFRYYFVDRIVSFDVVFDDNEFIDLIVFQFYVIYDVGKFYVDISEYNLNYFDWGGMGMSLNIIYVFEEMFEVSNDFWENNQINYLICVIIKSNYDNVLFFVGDYDSLIVGLLNNFEFMVNYGDFVLVGMIFDNINVSFGMDQFQFSFEVVVGECGSL